MNYNEAFTDWEKRREEAAWLGLRYKDYSRMYSYIQQRIGTGQAETFNGYSKATKRLFCARVVYLHSSDEEKRKKAKKYLEKHKGEDGIIWPK